jgi:hypothetical protein
MKLEDRVMWRPVRAISASRGGDRVWRNDGMMVRKGKSRNLDNHEFHIKSTGIET